jgi:hypothetical protein
LTQRIYFNMKINYNIDSNSLSRLVRKDMDVNEHERLSNITLRSKSK